MLLVEVFADTLHGTGLIGTIHNVRLRQHVDNVLTSTFLYQLLQVLTGMEPIDCSGRIAQSVDDVSLVAIGVIDHRLHAESCFQTFRIEFCMRLAHHRVNGRLLGFYHCQRHTVSVEQHIVCIADARWVWHTMHLNLNAGFSAYDSIVSL